MKVFLDSSVLIEYFKERTEAVELLEYILSRTDFKIFVNDIVYSEVAYIFIRTKAGKSHLTLKKVNRDIISAANDFMTEYGLPPNDALIIGCLVSLDEDFKKPCEDEGIRLISNKRSKYVERL